MNKKSVIIATFLLLTFTSFLIFRFFKKDKREPAKATTEEVVEPPFKKEGVLSFISGKDTLATISIEIADNERETTQGLMYRKSMPDTTGMLFVFPNPDLHAFWMKNTHISLDIIYVDQALKIIDIQKYTTPYSTTSLPSSVPMQYAVEVNAGYCDKKGIKVGDRIVFKRV